MKLQNYSGLLWYGLILLSSCHDIKGSKPGTLSGRWKIQSSYLTDDHDKIISRNENKIADSSYITLNKDSAFQMNDNGNIVPYNVAELLKLDDTIIGSWHTSNDSLQLIIPYKSKIATDTAKFVTATYKIMDHSGDVMTLKGKIFETETYRVLKFSKY
jgi:hypothetical protein